MSPNHSPFADRPDSDVADDDDDVSDGDRIPHPFVTAFSATHLVFHRQCRARPHLRWPASVWLRLAQRHLNGTLSMSSRTPSSSSSSTMHPNYRLVPLPTLLYERLTAAEFLRSDHYVILPAREHADLVGGGGCGGGDGERNTTTQHWRQLVFLTADALSVSESRGIDAANVTQAILKRPNASALVAVRPASPDAQLQAGAVYCSETCYENCVAKFKLDRRSGTGDDSVRVQLLAMAATQRAPQLATRATIFAIQQPYELPNELLDAILAAYFTAPRILYRNYTYEIRLDAQLLGQPLWVRHLTLLRQMRRLHFRCVHLESADNGFELCAVVLRGRTTLQQTTSIRMAVPRRRLHDRCPAVEAFPAGLGAAVAALRASMMPFVGQMATSAAASGDDRTPTPTAEADVSGLNARPMLLLHGPRGAGKTTVLHAVAAAFGIPVLHIDCSDIVSAVAAQQEAKLRLALARAALCRPLVVALLNFELFGADAEGREDLRAVHAFEQEMGAFFGAELADGGWRLPVVVVALSNGTAPTRPLLRRAFVDAIAVDALDKEQRRETLEWMHRVHRMSVARVETLPLCERNAGAEFTARFDDIAELLADVADRTPGFLYGDLKLLYGNAVNQQRFRRLPALTRELFDQQLNHMQAQFADSLGAPKVPKVLWSDIGGLAKLKEEIQTSIGLPLKHMHLMGRNLRRSGILLYGPPGTGKTLVAKAVATECNLAFLSVQGPELLNMYVGQSEQNVREVFARARSAAPCVVFLDELDSLAPNRGAAGDSGGVMDRVVSQLMTEMNGTGDDADPTKQLFILAATNRPDLIDPSLLRPGRFDKLLYVGPCTTTDEKMAVFAAQTKKFNLAADLQLSSVAKLLPASMTGADMNAICSNAWMSAVRRTIYAHQAKPNRRRLTNGRVNGDDVDGDTNAGQPTAEDVIVELGDFVRAAGEFVPSVSAKDMEYFIRLKASFSAA